MGSGRTDSTRAQTSPSCKLLPFSTHTTRHSGFLPSYSWIERKYPLTMQTFEQVKQAYHSRHQSLAGSPAYLKSLFSFLYYTIVDEITGDSCSCHRAWREVSPIRILKGPCTPSTPTKPILLFLGQAWYFTTLLSIFPSDSVTEFLQPHRVPLARGNPYDPIRDLSAPLTGNVPHHYGTILRNPSWPKVTMALYQPTTVSQGPSKS